MGDVSQDGSNGKNVVKRRKKEIGLISQIMEILNSVSLVQYYFKISLVMRNSMLVNGILTNAVVWYNLSDKQIEVLEDVDRSLLKMVLNAHSNIALESFHLETGTIPLRFIIPKRRLMYLWNIMVREDVC